MGGLLVIFIILACIGYQYQKGTFVRSLAALIIAICASAAAFNYFEVLADVFISRSDNSRFESIAPWAQSLSFALLFILAFAILRTISTQVTKTNVDLGTVAEKAGRILCGFLLGLFLAGLTLTAAAMAPLANKYPYQRFEETADAQNPNKALLNADSFAVSWFNLMSKGCFSGQRSFAAIHPDFIDQSFLNRHRLKDDISLFTTMPVLTIPPKNAAWPAPESLEDSDNPGQQAEAKSGHNIVIVRVGLKRSIAKKGGEFTLSQLKLVCKKKTDMKDPLAGQGKTVYPIGYLSRANFLQKTKLDEIIALKRIDFDEKEIWIDFAFNVPTGYVPILVELKQNNIAQIPPMISSEKAPKTIPFTLPIEITTDAEEAEEESTPYLQE